MSDNNPLLPTSKTYNLPPAGLQPAVLVDVFDDGISKPYQGQPGKPQFRFVFELGARTQDGAP